MAKLLWDQTSERKYENGIDRGVLYIPTSGIYSAGYAWNGLTTVTESPSGAEQTPLYADNIKYLNLTSTEEFGGTIEAYTYPQEFEQCDGTATASTGVTIGQQTRSSFGLSYRTKIGNDLTDEAGYKLHLVYGAKAMPSEKAYATINDSPEALTFSWEFMTTAIDVTGYKRTSLLTIDSTKVQSANLTTLEDALYGTAGTTARLPLPDEVFTMFAGSQTLVTPTAPTFVSSTGVITIPAVTGVTYRRADTNAVVAAGAMPAIASLSTLVIRATPSSGAYKFTAGSDDDWSFTRTT